MQLARLSIIAQRPNNIIIFKTKPKSDEEVTIVSFQPAAGPSAPLTALAPKDLSKTELESSSDEEPQLATVSMQIN